MYHLIGKRVRVHLWDARGTIIGSVEGTVSDVSKGVDIGGGQKRDLVLVTGIEGYTSPHLKEEGEGWFAVQDVEVIGDPVGGVWN
ncbi:MAG TPA: hypothetical protein VF190_02825 [Rhodothermales bacterium]